MSFKHPCPYRILFLSNKNSFVSRKNSGEFVDDVAGDFPLGLAVVVALAAAGDDADLVVVGTEAGALVAQRVEDDEVQVLLLQFVLGVGLLVVGFQGETDKHLPLALHLAQTGGDVGIGLQADDEVVVLALDFLVGRMLRPEVGDGSTEDGGVALREVAGGGVVHLLAALHVDTFSL